MTRWCSFSIFISVCYLIPSLILCHKSVLSDKDIDKWEISLDIEKAKSLTKWFVPKLHEHTQHEGRHRLTSLNTFYTYRKNPNVIKYRIIANVQVGKVDQEKVT